MTLVANCSPAEPTIPQPVQRTLPGVTQQTAAPNSDLPGLPAGSHITELGPGIIVVTTQPFAANTLFVRTPHDDIIMVDTPVTPSATDAVVDWIEAKWHRRVRWSIASHWHADASGGNHTLHARGIETISSRATATKLQHDGRAGKQGLLRYLHKTQPQNAQLLAEVEAMNFIPARRRIRIQPRATIKLGGETVILIYPGPSHSADSIGVYLPRLRLLYGGCAVRSDGKIQHTRGASPHWKEALGIFAGLDAQLVVPGHGQRFTPETISESVKAAERAFRHQPRQAPDQRAPDDRM